MKASDFVEFTGYVPALAQWQRICEEYENSQLSVQEFCEQWVGNGGITKCSEETAWEIASLSKELEEYRSKIETYELNKVVSDSILGAMLKFLERYKERLDELEKMVNSIQL